MTLLSTVCRFLILAKQVGYLPGSTFSNVANFIELKRFVDRREGLDGFFVFCFYGTLVTDRYDLRFLQNRMFPLRVAYAGKDTLMKHLIADKLNF